MTRKVKLSLFVSAFFLIFLQNAVAEPVSIRSAFDTTGQGWLFGSAVSGSNTCWIVVPRHVVSSEITGVPKRFSFVDKKRKTGFSGTPVTLEELHDSEGVVDVKLDLVFAPVDVVNLEKNCLSRLGPPGFTFDQIVSSGAPLVFERLSATSSRPFKMALDRVRSDENKGGLLQLRPLDVRTAETILKQGVSGAVGLVEWQNNYIPMAMLTNVDSQSQGKSTAIRFDLISQLFSLVKADIVEKPKNRNYGFGLSRMAPSTEHPDELTNPLTCWKANPLAGESMIEFVLHVDSSAAAVKGIAITADALCHTGKIHYRIDKRHSQSSKWTHVRGCDSMTPGGGADNESTSLTNCYLDLRTPIQLRIQIDSEEEIGINELFLH